MKGHKIFLFLRMFATLLRRILVNILLSNQFSILEKFTLFFHVFPTLENQGPNLMNFKF